VLGKTLQVGRCTVSNAGGFSCIAEPREAM